MGFIKIDRASPEYAALKKGLNLRWPCNGNQGADYIYICSSAEQVEEAANDALKNGYRITVRSGGHCTEGFVSNAQATPNSLPCGPNCSSIACGKPLAIIDVGQVKGIEYDPNGKIHSPFNKRVSYKFRIASGNQIWDTYEALYKLSGTTLPGGSAYSVGMGGHTVGGGTGRLSRLHGMVVDWLSGVDILVPSPKGKGVIRKHVHQNSKGEDRLLFIACRGGGGGNFGIVLNFYFHELPEAPRKGYLLSLSFPWQHWDRVGKEQFGKFLNAYWKWFHDNDKDWNNPDPQIANGGLYTTLRLLQRSTGNIGLNIQYIGKGGTVNEGNTKPFIDFVNTMVEAAGVVPIISDDFMMSNVKHPRAGLELEDPIGDATLYDWLFLAQTVNGVGAVQNNKVKSSFHIKEFTEEMIDALWNNISVPVSKLTQALVLINSYGGATNAYAGSNATAVYQRSSILYLDFVANWSITKDEEDQADEIADANLAWLRKIYRETYASEGGKPYPEVNRRFQGCYINDPDIDMKYTNFTHQEIDPRWLELYYGDRTDLLIEAKRAFDPKNLFYHQMSIPLEKPR